MGLAKNICIALLIITAGCIYQEKPSAVDCKGCNVLLIVVDTLRADHLGAYGYQRNTSPNIDAFAQKSILFANYFTVVPVTGPSMSSLFTGKYVNNHGFVRNRAVLNENETALAEVMPDGYKKAAVVSNPLAGKSAGLNAGFDEFEEIDWANADVITNRTIEWLMKNADKKFFLWAHYMDPHGAYIPPSGFAEQFMNDSLYNISNKIPLNFVSKDGLDPLEAAPEGRKKNITEVDYYIAHYDGEIRFTDEQIGKVLDYLATAGLLNNTLVIITADHGESMGENAYYFSHGMLVNDATIRIPLIISHPKSHQRMIVSSLAQNTDIFPTILRQLGIQSSQEIDGIDLTGLFLKENNIRDYVYSRTPSEFLTFFETIRTKTGKMIKSGSGKYDSGEYVFYDIQNDVTESKDAIGQLQPDEKEYYVNLFEKFGRDNITIKEAEFSIEAKRQLKALGYAD